MPIVLQSNCKFTTSSATLDRSSRTSQPISTLSFLQGTLESWIVVRSMVPALVLKSGFRMSDMSDRNPHSAFD